MRGRGEKLGYRLRAKARPGEGEFELGIVTMVMGVPNVPIRGRSSAAGPLAPARRLHSTHSIHFQEGKAHLCNGLSANSNIETCNSCNCFTSGWMDKHRQIYPDKSMIFTEKEG